MVQIPDLNLGIPSMSAPQGDCGSCELSETMAEVALEGPEQEAESNEEMELSEELAM